jgi:hypothetical protein
LALQAGLPFPAVFEFFRNAGFLLGVEVGDINIAFEFFEFLSADTLLEK